ncbi:hypothetical protein L1987_02688 [Smallanthus sonchifolius]|uniref:Uncharacterized protein n=1 Tax=Smallanthus sonchifolius TaxID=185202 RepID=A0ACB9K8I7_9ASTR|nr:hypothetical protein L1987_02688 [Smallanthus sonchifolius]
MFALEVLSNTIQASVTSTANLFTPILSLFLSLSLSHHHHTFSLSSIAQIWILLLYFTPQTSNSYLLNRRSKPRCLFCFYKHAHS